MNTYRVKFWAKCPNNEMVIDYALEIRTGRTIMVEDIRAFVDAFGSGYHEDIADACAAKFGGVQKMTAQHHGVTIETLRPCLHPWLKSSDLPEVSA